MEEKPQYDSRAVVAISSGIRTKGLVLGLVGGLAATIVIDLIGLALGVIFGAAVTRVDVLRLDSIRRGLGLGIPYAEVISLPILVMPPIILKWPASEAIQWFGFSFVMHAIWGMVLGVVMSWGCVLHLRPGKDDADNGSDTKAPEGR